MLWPEMHARATNPLEGKEQCAMNPLFDPRKLSCVDRLRSLTSWLHGYNTVVHKISGELSACANSGYHALLSQVVSVPPLLASGAIAFQR